MPKEYVRPIDKKYTLGYEYPPFNKKHPLDGPTSFVINIPSISSEVTFSPYRFKALVEEANGELKEQTFWSDCSIGRYILLPGLLYLENSKGSKNRQVFTFGGEVKVEAVDDMVVQFENQNTKVAGRRITIFSEAPIYLLNDCEENIKTIVLGISNKMKADIMENAGHLNAITTQAKIDQATFNLYNKDGALKLFYNYLVKLRDEKNEVIKGLRKTYEVSSLNISPELNFLKKAIKYLEPLVLEKKP